MRRSGLIGGTNQINDQQTLQNSLQTLKPNQAVYYADSQATPYQLTSYAAPNRQLSSTQQDQQQQSQHEQDQPQEQQLSQLQRQILLQKLKEIQQQRRLILQQQQLLQSQQPASQSNGLQGTEGRYSKAASDRQGYYDDAGYSGTHDGYISPNYGLPAHQEAYSPGHYHEPAHKEIYVPKPSVAIKIDPLAILKLLLSGIPKPLLNLNGKLFFGVELGKNVGLKKGYAPPIHGGGGKGIVLNLG